MRYTVKRGSEQKKYNVKSLKIKICNEFPITAKKVKTLVVFCICEERIEQFSVAYWGRVDAASSRDFCSAGKILKYASFDK